MNTSGNGNSTAQVVKFAELIVSAFISDFKPLIAYCRS